MKPLILSFFAILLCYSYFFDKDGEAQLRDMSQMPTYTQEKVTEPSDSLTLYAKRVNHNLPGSVKSIKN